MDHLNIIKANRVFLFILLFLFVIILTFCNTQRESEQTKSVAQITINTGSYERNNTPVSVSLNNVDYPFNDSSVVLIETTGESEEKVACQLEFGATKRLWWRLDGTTPENTQRTYELRSATKNGGKKTSLMDYTQNNESLILEKGEHPVLSYRHLMYPAPEGVDDIYKRNAYIHPLYSPNGNILTRIQPPDHYHHYGIWNPWTKTHFHGKSIDFWNLDEEEGTVRFNGFVSKVKGPVCSGFKVLHKHIDIKGDTTAINELWDVKVWNVSINGEEVFLWDLTTTLNCATDMPIMLEEYSYGGGIGFRATKEWKRENTRVLTSAGKNRKEADGTKARWCVTWADVEGKKPSGILFMSNPSNRQYPEPMRVWGPTYNDGRGDFFFEFCPIRHSPWELEPGKLYTLRYRMMVFDGAFPNEEEAEEVWNDFAHPPKVEVE